MEDENPVERLEGGSGPDDDAERKLREALARIDRVDEVHQRFVSEARRQVSELHLEATRARAAALEEARTVVAEAQAEAAAVLEAAREEAARLRAESETEVKAHAEVLLAVAHKERDDLMAAAGAAADRLREEAAVTGESLLNTAQAKAVRLVQEAKEEAERIRAESGGAGEAPGAGPVLAGVGGLEPRARRAGTDVVAQEADLRRLQDELRALAQSFGEALDALAAQSAAARRAPVAEPAPGGLHHGEVPEAPAPVAEPAQEAVETSVPLIGSRRNQGPAPAPPSPVSPAPAVPEAELHPRPAGPVGGTSAWTHSSDWPRPRRGRGWRYRGA